MNETKKVKVQGVLFTIRKLRALDYMSGANVLTSQYQTWEEKRKSDKGLSKTDAKKQADTMKKHYREVFLSCVEKPVLSRKPDPVLVCVDEIFDHPEMPHELYMEIMYFTYGKKKIQALNI